MLENRNGYETASFHGHSPYSDGLSDVPRLVMRAARVGINYFGISDHNTADGVRALHDEVTKRNELDGLDIIPVSAVEISTNQGDVLVALPGNYDPKFIDWGNEWSKNRHKYGVKETIQAAVEIFNALCVIVHPGEPLVAGMSLGLIREIPNFLDELTVRNVGLETRNWSTLLLPRRARIREVMVDQLALKLGLARFGFSDFHHEIQISRQITRVETEVHSAQGLREAVQARKISPDNDDDPTFIDLASLFVIFSITHFRPRLLEVQAKSRRLLANQRQSSVSSST